jgi:hypothetical protein
VERLSIDFAGTFDLAQWCKLLRDRGWTGHQVARALGRSEGYVNNLIRILERASLEVLARWKTEQQAGSSLTPICATDWLTRMCLLPPDQQRVELAKRSAREAATDPDIAKRDFVAKRDGAAPDTVCDSAERAGAGAPAEAVPVPSSSE